MNSGFGKHAVRPRAYCSADSRVHEWPVGAVLYNTRTCISSTYEEDRFRTASAPRAASYCSSASRHTLPAFAHDS